MSKIHFVVFQTNDEKSRPEFGIMLEEDHSLCVEQRFFSLYKGVSLEYQPEQIKWIRFVEKREFGESGPTPDDSLLVDQYSLEDFLVSECYQARREGW
jgi:hypothetical protein